MQFANLKQRLKSALNEDAVAFDVTTLALPKIRQIRLQSQLIAKKIGVMSGGFLIPLIFRQLDSHALVRIHKKDGAGIKPGQVVASIQASTPALLGGERLMLNLVCHLSGVATLTRQFVDAVKGTHTKILDTRKTTPLWRDLEKYAVVCGGGENHRFSLGDAVLVKDNHMQFMKQKNIRAHTVYGIDSPLRKRNRKLAFVAIEAKDIREVWEAVKCRPDIILLDNMPINQLKDAIVFIKAARKALDSDKPLIEISGGVTLKNVRALAELGVDRISVGALTHSAPAMDFSLEVN